MTLEIQGVPLSTGHIASAVAIVDENGNQVIGATGSNNENVPNWIGDYYNSLTVNSSSGTGAQTLITGSPGYYVTRLFVQITPNATITTAGNVTLTFADTVSGQQISQLTLFIPSLYVAPTVPTIPPSATPGAGFFYRSKNANSTLTVTPSVALVTGSIRVAVNGGITSIAS